MAHRRPMGDEDHAWWHFPGDALERDLTRLGPHQHAVARLNADGFHIAGMHCHRAHDCLIFGGILPNVDLLPLPGRPDGIHDETHRRHLTHTLTPTGAILAVRIARAHGHRVAATNARLPRCASPERPPAALRSIDVHAGSITNIVRPRGSSYGSCRLPPRRQCRRTQDVS